jgi:hypothetical protein
VSTLDSVDDTIGTDAPTQFVAGPVRGQVQREPIPLGTDFISIPEDEQNKLKIMTALRSKGINPTAAAAILGNIDVETGGSFRHDQMQESSVEGEPSYGIFQFEKDGLGLAEPYDRYLLDNGIEDSLDSQVGFMADILNGEYAYGLDYIT